MQSVRQMWEHATVQPSPRTALRRRFRLGQAGHRWVKPAAELKSAAELQPAGSLLWATTQLPVPCLRPAWLLAPPLTRSRSSTMALVLE